MSHAKSSAIIKIENVVASATLNQKVDLNAVVKSYPGVEYRPNSSQASFLGLRNPRRPRLFSTRGKWCAQARNQRKKHALQ